MALRVPRLVEELWHAVLCRPTSSGRWDIGQRGVDLVKEKVWYLEHVDLSH
jgi:hypothetical protein